jgi:type I restriction enzyme S subunit
LDFPIPPIDEQKRIVEKLNNILPQIKNIKIKLEKIPAILKKFRQSVLKDAFIDEEKFQLLGSIVDSRLGKILDKNKNKGTLKPYLRNINVRWFGFDLNHLLEMRFEDDEENQFNIVKGDLVICEGGEPGRCAIWESDNPVKYQKALHRVRPFEKLSAKYLMYYLKYMTLTGEMEQFITGTGIKHFTGESLKKIPIPLPLLEEQQKIVNCIESFFTPVYSLEARYNKAMERVEKIEQAVLAKAFRGELVVSDPNDEPAEELLERVRKIDPK